MAGACQVKWAVSALQAHAFASRATAERHHFLLNMFLLSGEMGQKRNLHSGLGSRLLALQQTQASEASGPSSGLAGWMCPSYRHRPRLACRRWERVLSASIWESRKGPGRSTQTAGRTDSALSSQLPGTALQPRQPGRQVGGSSGPLVPHSPGDCSPSRQAVIKGTDVSLVSLSRARNPQDPDAPIPVDSALARPF